MAPAVAPVSNVITTWPCEETEPRLTPAPILESFSLSVSGVPGEMLLRQSVRMVTPSYRDNMSSFDDKIFSLGMKRSDTQQNTPANGNCGPEGTYLN